METFFKQLNFDNIKNKTIIIDVDGTITHDSRDILDLETIDKIKELKINNRVYLSTNNNQPERNKNIAARLDVEFIKTDYKKPSQKSISSIQRNISNEFLIIGDKYLTDGLLAKRVDADFIKVKRLRSRSDSLFVKISYFVDDLIYKLLPYLSIIRPTQWIKNFLIFIPIIFAREFFIPEKLMAAIFAFIIFCLAAGSVYIINDIIDLKADQLHLQKKKRPLPSGLISIKKSLILLSCLLIICLGLIIVLVPKIFFFILTYFILNLLYSLILKNVVIFDILTIIAFYLLRIFSGGAATDTAISPWLILCLAAISLLIILGKRKSEFYQTDRRAVLKKYSAKFLNSLLNAAALITIIVYFLYTLLGNNSSFAIYSNIFVLTAILRLVDLIHKREKLPEFPEKLILNDKIILISIIGWLVFWFIILY